MTVVVLFGAAAERIRCGLRGRGCCLIREEENTPVTLKMVSGSLYLLRKSKESSLSLPYINSMIMKRDDMIHVLLCSVLFFQSMVAVNNDSTSTSGSGSVTMGGGWSSGGSSSTDTFSTIGSSTPSISASRKNNKFGMGSCTFVGVDKGRTNDGYEEKGL